MTRLYPTGRRAFGRASTGIGGGRKGGGSSAGT